MTTKHLILALLFGCGGGGSSHGSVALVDLGTAIGHSYCTKEFACCTDAEVMMDFGSFKVGGQPITTEMQCETFYNAFITGLLTSEYMDSIAKGRMVYDADAAGSCIGLIDDLTCPEFGGQPMIVQGTDCQQFVIPQVDDGGACAQSYECKSNNCIGATTSPAKDGACMPVPGSGESCNDTCMDGQFCDFSSGSKCMPLRSNGTSCSSRDQCVSDYCDTSAGNGMCADKAARCDGR